MVKIVTIQVESRAWRGRRPGCRQCTTSKILFIGRINYFGLIILDFSLSNIFFFKSYFRRAWKTKSSRPKGPEAGGSVSVHLGGHSDLRLWINFNLQVQDMDSQAADPASAAQQLKFSKVFISRLFLSETKISLNII